MKFIDRTTHWEISAINVTDPEQLYLRKGLDESADRFLIQRVGRDSAFSDEWSALPHVEKLGSRYTIVKILVPYNQDRKDISRMLRKVAVEIEAGNLPDK